MSLMPNEGTLLSKIHIFIDSMVRLLCWHYSGTNVISIKSRDTFTIFGTVKLRFYDFIRLELEKKSRISANLLNGPCHLRICKVY